MSVVQPRCACCGAAFPTVWLGRAATPRYCSLACADRGRWWQRPRVYSVADFQRLAPPTAPWGLASAARREAGR